jgi:hypothetical protein
LTAGNPGAAFGVAGSVFQGVVQFAAVDGDLNTRTRLDSAFAILIA